VEFQVDVEQASTIRSWQLPTVVKRSYIIPETANAPERHAQAKKSFRDWHGQRWLSPAKLLEQPTSSVRPVLLPFWLFEASVRVQHSATLGFAAEGCAYYRGCS